MISASEATFEVAIDVTEQQVRRALRAHGVPSRLAARAAQRLYRQSLGFAGDADGGAIARADAKRARKAAGR